MVKPAAGGSMPMRVARGRFEGMAAVADLPPQESVAWEPASVTVTGTGGGGGIDSGQGAGLALDVGVEVDFSIVGDHEEVVLEFV